MQRTDSSEKTSDVVKQLVLQLTGSCECAITTKYIADGRLVCSSEPGEVVILQGRIISTTTKNSTDLVTLLQEWVLGNPTVIIQGVQLKVESECSVQLKTLGDTTCRPIGNYNSPDKLSCTVGGAVVLAVGGVLAIEALLVIIVVGVLLCVKKRYPCETIVMESF